MRLLPTWIAVLLLCALVYWPGLYGPFVFDDFRNLAPLDEWLAGDLGWQGVVWGNTSGEFGRPVAMASFVLNAALTGSQSWGLKAGNLLVHLIAGCLVYALMSAFRRQASRLPGAGPVSAWLPLVGATIWLLHPLMVSTVLYVVQRMAMLSAVFMLLAMITYTHGRIALDDGRRRLAFSLLGLGVPLSTLLAILSKENGIVAFSLCAVIELALFAPRRSERRPWPSRIVIAAGLVLPALFAIGLVLAQHPLVMDGYANRTFGLGERLLTQSRVLWDYLASLALPNGPSLGVYHDDYPVARGLFSPASTAVALLAWAGIIGLAWYLRRSVPGLLLGLGIYLVGHAVESSIFPLMLYFEHRSYLPAVGAIYAFLDVCRAVAARLASRMDHPARIYAGAGAGLVLALALATGARASIWRDKEAIITQALAHHPDSSNLRMDAARLEMLRQPPDQRAARAHLAHLAASSDAEHRRLAAIGLSVIDCLDGIPFSDENFRHAFGTPTTGPLQTDMLLAYEHLGGLIESGHCPGLVAVQAARAFDELSRRSSLPPDNYNLARLRYQAAKLYASSEHYERALSLARKAVLARRPDAQMWHLVAQLEVNMGRFKEASQALDRAEALLGPHDRQGKETLGGLRQLIRDKRHGTESE
jgi:protein O-mannosyl-transferase